MGLNAEQISEDVEAWWKLLYKLGKQLFEYPGAKRIADMVRNKVEKFKVLLPVLCAICNKVRKEIIFIYVYTYIIYIPVYWVTQFVFCILQLRLYPYETMPIFISR